MAGYIARLSSESGVIGCLDGRYCGILFLHSRICRAVQHDHIV